MTGEQQVGLTVLIAERYRTVAQSLARIVTGLGNARVAAAAHSAPEAVALTSKLAPDVAIVDLELSPNCALVRRIHELSPETRIIVMADRFSPNTSGMVQALASGAVGAIYKEASLDELARAVSTSSRQTPVLPDEAAGLLLSSYVEAQAEKRRRDLATIEALATALEARDSATGSHLRRVTDLAYACMERIDVNLARNEEVAFGFMLHDVGKIGVPDSILNKAGPLSGDEWDVMKQHPELGVQIVEPIGFSPTATDIILAHHERWDGSGYPRALTREEIPLTARTFAVADAYDAMTTDRPYRSAMSEEDALEYIWEGAGRVFDPEIVGVFIDLAD